MFRQKVQTLNQFIVEKQAEHPGAKGDLSRLLHHVGIAAKIVNRAVNKAGLVDILGRSGVENVQGEEQQKLDVFADITFINEMKVSGEVAAVATEEREEIIVFDDRLSRNAKYVFCMDPLDGSSNIDVNASVGTIFSIYERKTKRGELADKEDFLRKGTEQIAAGYVVYGSSTMLVYTTGMGVYGFTLDPSIGEFCLSHPNIKTPDVGTIYSINESNYSKFPDGVKQFMKYLQAQNTGDKRLYTSRYIGTLVADFHRNLLKGGIFLYPQTSANPNGKLRLSYECNPMAFIAEQAGGKAGDGKGRILDIIPDKIHQRVVFYTGSPCMMDKLNEYLQKYS